MSDQFQGIFAALVTPMTAEEELDCASLGKLIESLIANGIGGVIPLGTTGEAYALSTEERETVLKATIEAVAGRVPVVAGANAASTREVVAFCQNAEKLGASDPVTFGGRLGPDAEGFIAKAMARNGRGGDWRDRETVEAWAGSIADELLGVG